MSVRIVVLSFLMVLGAGAAARAQQQPYEQTFQGAFGAVEIGTSRIGATLLGDVGVASHGLRALSNRHWLIQWDGTLALTGGALVRTAPPNPLIGGSASASVELGYRFGNAHWSPYLGVGADAGLRVVASTEVPLSRIATLGALDGIGGISAGGGVRGQVGAVWQSGEHWLELALVGQTALRLPTAGVQPLWLNGGGLQGRWDIAKKLSLTLRGTFGVSTPIQQAALGLTHVLVRSELVAAFRYRFENHTWFGLQSTVGREQSLVTYSGAHRTYATSEPPVIALLVQYGVLLGAGR